jgi:hypothetical protein
VTRQFPLTDMLTGLMAALVTRPAGGKGHLSRVGAYRVTKFARRRLDALTCHLEGLVAEQL